MNDSKITYAGGSRFAADFHIWRGFTLIEVLVVIGIIAILAVMVLTAVNPARQFKLARDSERESDVNAILNAIDENMSEHRGIFTCGGTATVLPATSTLVASAASVPHTDIAGCLVPDYMSSLPFDPSMPGAHFHSVTDYDTGYEVSVDADGHVTASSTGELTPAIRATR